ncbi:hypothetical protein C1645_823863, partial [Glomus cerebriforme]
TLDDRIKLIIKHEWFKEFNKFRKNTLIKLFHVDDFQLRFYIDEVDKKYHGKKITFHLARESEDSEKHASDHSKNDNTDANDTVKHTKQYIYNVGQPRKPYILINDICYQDLCLYVAIEGDVDKYSLDDVKKGRLVQTNKLHKSIILTLIILAKDDVDTSHVDISHVNYGSFDSTSPLIIV